MNRYYYSDSIATFVKREEASIYGILASNSEYAVEPTQRDAWIAEIRILKDVLAHYSRSGKVYFEYSIPRLGRRIDVVAIIRNVIFVIEFKVGDQEFTAAATDQVCDYALDLKNFHETSHELPVAPLLIATAAEECNSRIVLTPHNDKLLEPIQSTTAKLGNVIQDVLDFVGGGAITADHWEAGRYCPTPTIIEAATSLYNCHSVADISRSDASATNLTQTSDVISKIIRAAKTNSKKAICFVTGVPGAGKTLVGLDIATKHIDKSNELYSVFLSGNGPLVAILREALARDKVRREKEQGRKQTKSKALRSCS